MDYAISESQNKQRDASIDTMKGILVFLMVLTHVFQFFPINEMTSHFSTYVNLTTFSGFMFTFGYVSSKAYIHNELNTGIRAKKLFRGWIKTLGAFYLSGIAYTILIRNDISLYSIIKILLLINVPGYSEFLLSFSFMYLLVLVFYKPLKIFNGQVYLLLGGISLALTFVKQDIFTQPIFGAFIGIAEGYGFPILLYFSYFLAGAYLSRCKKTFSPQIFVISIVGAICFFVNFQTSGTLPRRFPPSALWIMGGYIFIYAYYFICKKYYKQLPLNRLLAIVGQDSLWYLVISNIIIFTFYKIANNRFATLNSKMQFTLCMIIFVLCIGVTLAVHTGVNKSIKRLKRK